MIAGHKRYPVMKDSGVPWLGEVPKHWQLQRLRNLAEMRVSNVDKHTKEGEEPVRLCNYVDVYKNVYIRRSMRFMRATATKHELDRFRLVAGDVLITKDSEAWNDIGVPALVAESADDLVSGYHLALLRPFRSCITGAYLLRALQSIGVQYQFHVGANGVTRYGLSHAAIKAVWLPSPPLPEQAAIVRFLDHADRRIRRYIRAKQRLINLLAEQKQAIIHRAVTRGLNPNVRLKPSGVEWLWDVPGHWEVARLGRLIVDGPRNGISPPIEDSGGVPSFSISAVREGVVVVRDEHRKFVAGDKARLSQEYCLLTGDILLVRGNGNIRLVGKAGVLEEDMPGWVYPDLLMRVRVAPTCLPSFVAALLNSQVGRDQIETAARTAVGTFKINNQQVRQLWFAWPPLTEQRQILEWLSHRLRDVKNAIRRADEQVGLLREYRSRLLADVVTGKLDVREAAARLTDEVEEPEPLDEVGAKCDAETVGAEGAEEVPVEVEA